MFKTTQELKDFLLWCRQAKIQAVKVGDMEVTFSNIAFLDLQEISPETAKELKVESSAQQAADAATEQLEDEDLLFWSVGSNSVIPPQG